MPNGVIGLDDAAELLGLARESLYQLCWNRKGRGVILRPVYGSRSGDNHRVVVGIEPQSIVEYHAWRAIRAERMRETCRENRSARSKACPRCELITETGGLCQMCQAELAGRRYYAARPLPHVESSWMAPCVEELP